MPICEGRTSVLLKLYDRPEIDVSEVRQWVEANVKGKFKLFHRVQYEEHPVRVDRVLLGLNFRFDNLNDAMLFKLGYGGV